MKPTPLLEARALFAFAALILAGALGCARKTYPQAETVASAPDGRFWAAGSEGFAAYSKNGDLFRSDYAMNKDAYDYAYETMSPIPVGHVVHADGETLLFTRYGDAFAFQAGAWAKLPMSVRDIGGDNTQVDNAIIAPAGTLLIRLHENKLLWSTPRRRLDDVTFEDLPSYFSWIGFAANALYAIGWEGPRRAVMRRDNYKRWSKVAVLGATYDNETLHAVVTLPTGEPALVTGKEILVFREGGATESIRPRSLRRRPTATVAEPMSLRALSAPFNAMRARPWGAAGGSFFASPWPEEPALGGGLGGAPGQEVAVPRGSQGPEGSKRPQAVAVDSPEINGPNEIIHRVLEVPGRGHLLVLIGTDTTLMDLADPEALVPHCPSASLAVGAVMLSDGLRLISSDAAAFRVLGDTCGMSKPALIRSEY